MFKCLIYSVYRIFNSYNNMYLENLAVLQFSVEKKINLKLQHIYDAK